MLEGTGRGSENNMNTDLKEMAGEGVYWIMWLRIRTAAGVL